MGKIDIWDIVIIGGGLAGLTCALDLSRFKLKILLIEKQRFPHHKVCGEYVSNEILPYFKSIEIDPFQHGAKVISKFQISNKKGKLISTDLPLGGFGISRYALDNILYSALKDRVEVVLDTVTRVDYKENVFHLSTNDSREYTSHYVVGAFGKRSNIDTVMKRDFMQTPSPWLAVKSHYQYPFPENTVALHNFDGGYCGLSKTETNAVNACYLTTYSSFKRFGNIPDFEKHVLSENKYLDNFLKNAKPLFEKPLTISQISFDQKQPVENHIFMIGDSAGLIHPLCGNGMAMAIHSAKLFSETFMKFYNVQDRDRDRIESEYTAKWRETFADRLRTGRTIQNMLLRPIATRIGFSIASIFPSIVPSIIKKTHGTPII